MKQLIDRRVWHRESGAFRTLKNLLSAHGPATLSLASILIFFGVTYGRFFPGPKGLGHDYAFFLPDLLSNFYWAKVNGPWFAPWFTPAFCGGQPAFADPQSLYYSLPQLLTAFMDPVASIFWTFLTFGALGFLGMYLLLQDSVKASRSAAIVGGALFAMNGFFIHRMLIGHLAFHGFMLVPLLAWTATSTMARADLRLPASWGGVVFGSLIVAYWVMSGMAVLLIPALVCVLLLLGLHAMRGNPVKASLVQTAVSVAAGLGLSISKVVASLAYVKQIPRDAYPLGGLPATGDSLQFALSSIFLGPESISAITATELATSRHEFEFSLTPVAALLIVSGGLLWVVRSVGRGKKIQGPGFWGLVTVFVSLLAIPVVLNTAYGPQWESLLKSIPIIKSSSTMLRWFCIYLPVTCMAAALCFDTITHRARLRRLLALAAVACACLWHFQSDSRFYASQGYDPRPVQLAFDKARTSSSVPVIQTVAIMVDAKGDVVQPLNRNDQLANGNSPLLCYNPMFGYGLEFFPAGPLRPGPALAVKDGLFNIKNPSCYLYPQENLCSPGSHFNTLQESQARNFLAYRAFPFKISVVQQVANRLNLIMVVGTILLLLWIAGRKIRRWSRP